MGSDTPHVHGLCTSNEIPRVWNVVAEWRGLEVARWILVPGDLVTNTTINDKYKSQTREVSCKTSEDILGTNSYSSETIMY